MKAREGSRLMAGSSNQSVSLRDLRSSDTAPHTRHMPQPWRGAARRPRIEQKLVRPCAGPGPQKPCVSSSTRQCMAMTYRVVGHG
jgi:hypothetical protein